YQPCDALRNFVNNYTIAYLISDQPIVRLQPAYPRQYLIFYPTGRQQVSIDGRTYEFLPQELVIGPFTQPVRMLINPLQLTIIVNLLPGVLHRISHLPLHEILNSPLDGINGFGNEIKRLNEQLSEAAAQDQMVELIEAFLLRKIQKAKEPLPIDHIFNLLITSPDQYTIDKLANISCVSLRQFERQFMTRIGTTPTMFIRQARFAKAFRVKRAYPQLSWTSVAYECGYFDQMHFIRDFKLFTSATPTSFKTVLPA
ncbi:MAG TPA: helix-turn-helix transcriptional regulator, partial [Acidobacteriota bacterium]